MTPVVLIPGTWANSERNAAQDFWWRPGSPFCRAMQDHGLHPLSFAWDTRLDGVLGDNDEWQKAAMILYRQTKDLQPLTAIAHSHGGNVAIVAAAAGLKIRKLVTLATPVRADVPYEAARRYIGHWSHIYGGKRDWVQLAGSLFDGHFGLRRRMKLADANVKLPECGHNDVHQVDVWNRHSLWLTFYDPREGYGGA